ncbi:hypothetical protein KKF32_02110 [Patescibacteria group bacterium]|nr:hypothetical protein [Patescibacteria group bacterium]
MLDNILKDISANIKDIWINIIIFVFLIPSFIWCLKWIYRKCKPLKISPSSRKILTSKDGDNYSEEFFIYLINHTQRTYYDISIISKFPKGIVLSTYPEPATHGDCGISCEGSDQVIINNIRAKGQVKIKVNVDKNKYNKNFILKFKITNFSKTAKSVYRGTRRQIR